jgi:hypothetical protein
MKVVEHMHENGKTGEAALADALTSKSATVRIMARGVAADWLTPFTIWMNDELRRPKAEPAKVVAAISMLMVQTLASIAAQISEPSGDRIFVEAFIDLARHELPKHMAKTREQQGWE